MNTYLLFCTSLMVSALPAPGENSPRALIQRAIKAHGGADNLSRLHLVYEKTVGTIRVLDREVSFRSENWMRMPDQFRHSLKMEIGGKPLQVIQAFDGRAGWINENGLTRDGDATSVAHWRELLHACHVSTLTPLLAGDKGYQLTNLGESKLGERLAVGVKISFRDRQDVQLYFDRESGLMVQKVYHPRPNDLTFVQEERYSDYKEIAGVKRPTRVVIFQNGKKYAVAEFTEVRFLEKIDDRMFAKP